MKLADIADKMPLKFLCLPDNDLLNNDFTYAFASDLMSDALYLVNHDAGKTLLLTGHVNTQSLITAEMLDIKMLIYVRNKEVPQELLNLAKDKEIGIAAFAGTMFKACGLLYDFGLKEAS